MKALNLFLLIVSLAAIGCKDPKPSPNDPGKQIDTTDFTTIEWLDTAKNFGTIQEGEKLAVSFQFKNTGEKPLVIDLIKPSCGCTLVEEPQGPVAAGNVGEVKAVFNSEGKPGLQHKNIFVMANTKRTREHTLSFQVEVLKKDK